MVWRTARLVVRQQFQIFLITAIMPAFEFHSTFSHDLASGLIKTILLWIQHTFFRVYIFIRRHEFVPTHTARCIRWIMTVGETGEKKSSRRIKGATVHHMHKPKNSHITIVCVREVVSSVSVSSSLDGYLSIFTYCPSLFKSASITFAHKCAATDEPLFFRKKNFAFRCFCRLIRCIFALLIKFACSFHSFFFLSLALSIM